MGAQEILEALSEVMDEQDNESALAENEREARAHYNNIRRYISQDLTKCMEGISYEGKFTAMERADLLADSIGLYMRFPELINKYVIGCYGFDKEQVKMAWGKYLGEEYIFSSRVPTILTYGEDETEIHALNLAGKRSALSRVSCQRLESDTASSVNISSVLYAYQMNSASMPEDAAVIFFPGDIDKQQPYYKVLFLLLDVLIAYGGTMKYVPPELDWDLNLKELVLVGSLKQDIVSSITQKLKCSGAKLVDGQSAAEALETRIHGKHLFSPGCAVSNNFCNQTAMENCLCVPLWHLAQQKKELNIRIKQVNNSLMSDDTETQEQAQKLQKKIREMMDTADECSRRYMDIMQKILSEIGSLQENYGVEETKDSINQHLKMGEYLLELLAVEGMFYKQYPDQTAGDHIRKLGMLYEKLYEDSKPAEALSDQYFGVAQDSDSLKAFVRYETSSPILLHKKLEMCMEIGLSLQECRQFIVPLGDSLTALEFRLLGIAELEEGNWDSANSALMQAMRGGDQEAGEFMYRSGLYEEMSELADYGVEEAAYELGKRFYAEFQSDDNPATRRKTMKYLHIAAAKKHKGAVRLLGDIWYYEALCSSEEKKEKKYESSLYYYQIAESIDMADVQLIERMGRIYYTLENYLRARTYLEKADTAEACYILGVMYDKAQGIPRNRNKALFYYERAMSSEKGHYFAALGRKRIMEEEAEEKKKQADSENTSYRRTSENTNYSSSSAW